MDTLATSSWLAGLGYTSLFGTATGFTLMMWTCGMHYNRIFLAFVPPGILVSYLTWVMIERRAEETRRLELTNQLRQKQKSDHARTASKFLMKDDGSDD
jgi:hypothetical protein